MITSVVKLLRLKHWIKNILICVPLVFSRDLFDSWDVAVLILLGFVSFGLISSAIYVFNDIADKEKDAQHPVKSKRPIASGAVSVSTAWFLVAFIGIIGVTMSAWLASFTSWWGLVVILSYLLLNIGYSAGLKRVPVIEIGILSSGFLLRVLYGGYVSGVEVSNWLYLTVLSMSLYLGLGKRRNELERHSYSATREVLSHYNRRFLDRNMYMFLASGICFYSLWAIGQHVAMVWSVPFVMLICMRYSLVLESGSEGDPVDVILKDVTLLTMGIIYGAYMLYVLYFYQI